MLLDMENYIPTGKVHTFRINARNVVVGNSAVLTSIQRVCVTLEEFEYILAIGEAERFAFKVTEDYVYINIKCSKGNILYDESKRGVLRVALSHHDWILWFAGSGSMYTHLVEKPVCGVWKKEGF